MAIVLAPLVLIAIYQFPAVTQIPQQYDIRINDLIFYMAFGVWLAPFQVMMDIIINNAVEISHGLKVGFFFFLFDIIISLGMESKVFVVVILLTTLMLFFVVENKCRFVGAL